MVLNVSLGPCLKEANVARYTIVVALLNILLIHQSVLTLYVQPYSVSLKHKDRLYAHILQKVFFGLAGDVAKPSGTFSGLFSVVINNILTSLNNPAEQ